ncbi:hypothetical protein NEOLEDRAFT_1150799 [Neolentinus lepideus HHB14362 ss-1]|uniref:Uncharacterized protein n=1 Tax=Neolentinus lepideus HHB14362 ss-1 TaxID=1314782 RepID=A0A165PLR9_9AGAM|nr:hypothetical protein NEOLEDRAFT_1150799 [Neolentinus lepideus HHB14362 ss-1]
MSDIETPSETALEQRDDLHTLDRSSALPEEAEVQITEEPPAKKKCSCPPKQQAWGSSKSSGKMTQEAESPPAATVKCLFRRNGAEGLSERVQVDYDESFNEVIAVIHQTMGCSDTILKPLLQYKLSNKPKNAQKFALTQESDWVLLVCDLESAKRQKKQPIPMDIFTTDQITSKSFTETHLILNSRKNL